MAKLLCSVVVALIYAIAAVHGQAQQVTMYENTGSTGAFISLGATYVPDLQSHSFNNRARSVCVTGVWLFYDLNNYNGNNNAGMEFVFGNGYCVNFIGLGGAVTSVRYAGSPNDYRSPSLTLYSGTYFQGAEEYTNLDLPNLSLNGRISSLLVTGSPSDGWTLYNRPNYAGNGVCIYPPVTSNYEPAFIHDTTIISIPHNTIQSVRRGCFGSRTVVAKSVKQGYKQIVPEVTAYV